MTLTTSSLTFINQSNSADASVFQQQIGGKFEFAERDVLQGGCFGVEGASDLASGGIAVGVQHTGTAMSAFASEGELSSFAVELRAPGDEFLNTIGALFHQHAGSF